MRSRGIFLLAVVVLLFFASLSACRFQVAGDPVLLNGDWPIAYIKRPVAAWTDPISSPSFKPGTDKEPGSDLYLRDVSSPTSRERNITSRLTNGLGAVADPDVSYDGTKVIFSLRCAPKSSSECSVDSTWKIWIYNVVTDTLSPVIKDFEIANKGDDLDPTFLPDGRILFVSNRQKKTKDALGYTFLDEDQKTPALLLHRMTADGQFIEQISFNQSHDLNPSVMHDGRIVFSRWDNVAERSQISLYTANPDGSNLRILYGAHSPGEAFMFPRELADGRVMSTVMPRDGTWRGGALLLLDVKQYSDDSGPGPGVVAQKGRGQLPATDFLVPVERKAAKQGRYTSPFLVEDGTNRALVSYGRYQIGTKLDVKTRTNVPDLESESPFEYGIYMLDVDDKSVKPLILPEPGIAYTDPVALRPRPVPLVVPDRAPLSSAPRISANEEVGFIHVRSVYDTDEHGHFGNGMMTANERAASPVPLISPADPSRDSRLFVADIAKLKNPLQTTASQRPARFVRVSKAVPQPAKLDPRVVGLTPFSMQTLLGYAPIEPDGSFFIKVPADTSLTLTVLDSKGRAFVNHTAWLQVRPGEQLTCNGCHEPLRGAALNSAPIAGSHPNTQLRDVNGQNLVDSNQGLRSTDHETMAQTRVRLDPTSANLQTDIEFVDVWTDPAVRQVDSAIRIRYADLTTPAPVAGTIDYVKNVQPLWDKVRPGGRCIDCHNGVRNAQSNPSGLNLSATLNAGDGRPVSYNELNQAAPVFSADGKIVFETVGTTRKMRRLTNLVQAGYSRRSYLVEKLFNEELHADEGLPAAGLNHAPMLSDVERRLVVEWIDQGAQFANWPLDDKQVPKKLMNVVDKTQFMQSAWQVIKVRCNLCHYPFGNGGEANPRLAQTRFILAFDAEEDFYISLDFVDATTPALSAIITRPSGLVAHPPNNTGGPILDPTSNDYKTVLLWLNTPPTP